MEHYLLIADQDWTPNKDDSDDERWYYAAPGAVAALIARLQPHTKREQQSPTRFREFSGAIFATWPTDEDLQALRTRLDPYRILATPAALAQATSPVAKEYLRSHQPFTSPTDDQPAMLNWVHTRLYSGQQGYKLQISDLQFSRWYQGPIDYQGFDHVTVTGDFGSAFRPLAIYRWGALVDPNRTIKMWPEFAKDPSVELRYVVSEVVQTQPDTVTRRRVFTGAALEHELALVGAPTYSLLNVTVEVRGTGKLQLGPVHCRWSRFELGEFFPGGERLVDPTDRGDLLFYFNPGDLRPPLNIYFSGFRPAEGFEAFYMMRSMRAPLF